MTADWLAKITANFVGKMGLYCLNSANFTASLASILTHPFLALGFRRSPHLILFSEASFINP